MVTEAHISRYWNRVQKADGDACWEWTGSKDSYGYGMVEVAKKKKRATHMALYFHNGHFPTKHVLHSCDNPGCVNPNHLKEGTALENMHDMIVKGRARHPKGEEHQFARLTEKDVLKIRELIASGRYATSIARQFGISKTHVIQIGHGRKWKHVGGPLGFRSRLVHEEKQRQAIDLFRQGHRQSDICRTVGLSAPWLCVFLKKLNRVSA